MLSRLSSVLLVVTVLALGVGGVLAFHESTDTNEYPIPAASAAAQDVMVERSLQYFDRMNTTMEHEPNVMMSESVTFDHLRETGVAVLNLEEGCQLPFHIVIFEGQFQVDRLKPGGIVHPDAYEDQEPIKYVALIFNRETENLVGIVSDETGGRFKEILGDPALPDPEAHPDPEFGPFDDDTLPNNMRGAIPCE